MHTNTIDRLRFTLLVTIGNVITVYALYIVMLILKTVVSPYCFNETYDCFQYL